MHKAWVHCCWRRVTAELLENGESANERWKAEANVLEMVRFAASNGMPMHSYNKVAGTMERMGMKENKSETSCSTGKKLASCALSLTLALGMSPVAAFAEAGSADAAGESAEQVLSAQEGSDQAAVSDQGQDAEVSPVTGGGYGTNCGA